MLFYRGYIVKFYSQKIYYYSSYNLNTFQIAQPIHVMYYNESVV